VRRFATTVTILCFFVISMLQTSICCLCVPLGCESEAVVATAGPEEAGCESFRPAENACAEQECAPIQPQASSTHLDSSGSSDALNNGYRCVYVVVRLTAVLEERRDQAPEPPHGNSIPSGISITESKANPSLNCSRPQGVHPTISTTVLRC
jgi:hypothetical protein